MINDQNYKVEKSIFDMNFTLPPPVVLTEVEKETPFYVGEQTLDLTLMENFFIYLGSWWR